MILRILFITTLFAMTSCASDIKEDVVENALSETTVLQNTPLEESYPENEKKGKVVVENGTFKEYYADSKRVKFEGPQDENGKRHGKWAYFSKDGVELSMTMYSHGEKHGHSIVKYPNGNLHYTGEYNNNVQTGIWKTYSIEGKLMNTLDYSK